jgi:hypothetical protein
LAELVERPRHCGGELRRIGWNLVGKRRITVVDRVEHRRLGAKIEYKAGEEPAVEVAVVEFEPWEAVADPALQPRCDRVAGDADSRARREVTREDLLVRQSLLRAAPDGGR